MFEDKMINWLIVIAVTLNAVIAILFWLHEKLERGKMTRLRYAVEKAVRAVEQICGSLENEQKKQEALKRAEAFLGYYRWFVPVLVLDTAIEAELFLIRQMHDKLSVDHDTIDEMESKDDFSSGL